MSVAMIFLSLVIMIGVLTEASSDHAELVTVREVTATHVEEATEAFTASCAAWTGCNTALLAADGDVERGGLGLTHCWTPANEGETGLAGTDRLVVTGESPVDTSLFVLSRRVEIQVVTELPRTYQPSGFRCS